jgi:hypothetical protein
MNSGNFAGLIGRRKMPARGKDEGSPADIRQDRAGAKKAGMTQKAFERSAADRKADKARMAKKRKR